VIISTRYADPRTFPPYELEIRVVLSNRAWVGLAGPPFSCRVLVQPIPRLPHPFAFFAKGWGAGIYPARASAPEALAHAQLKALTEIRSNVQLHSTLPNPHRSHPDRKTLTTHYAENKAHILRTWSGHMRERIFGCPSSRRVCETWDAATAHGLQVFRYAGVPAMSRSEQAAAPSAMLGGLTTNAYNQQRTHYRRPFSTAHCDVQPCVSITNWFKMSPADGVRENLQQPG
jgi:hypothetical protein